MIFKGFRFGMLLQLAVGPLCILTFRASAGSGFWAGLQVTLAVALADAAFIALSGLGAAAALRRERIGAAVRWVGCLVLCLFGVHIILSALRLGILPEIRLFGASGGWFWQGFLLTVSNPLTIVFWGGVFAAQVSAHGYARGQLALFGAGCVLSTLVSLAAVAALGSLLTGFLPEIVMTVLNILVGAVLIGYGIRLLTKKDGAAKA